MRFFIIGGSGLVGSNCMTYLKDKGQQVIGSHLTFSTADTVLFDTLNLQNPGNYNIKSFNPDVIIHCGALTHVDYCETHEEESYEKNVLSAIKVIDLCKQLDAKLIYLSTDYVFDGENGPYTEDAIPHPVNIYGVHKLQAETKVLEQLPQSLVLRITNVYGTEIRNKNFISRIAEHAIENKELNLVLPGDQFATPINARDIGRVIYSLINKNSKGIYHLASTDYYNRSQLAKKVIQYFPFYTNYKIQVKTTAELGQVAKRPLLGGLIPLKFLKENPAFHFSNVDNYLQSLQNHIE